MLTAEREMTVAHHSEPVTRSADEPATVSLRIAPGESMAEFAARVAQAHGPLSQAEIARLRKIFAPVAVQAP